MKKQIITIVLLALTAISLKAQDHTNLPALKFEKAEDFSALESKVLESATYLFDHPVTDKQENRSTASANVLVWMIGTPDYTFELGEDFTDFSKGPDYLGGLYMASLVKAALENNALTPSAINERGRYIFLMYCKDPKNNVKQNKSIKKALKG